MWWVREVVDAKGLPATTTAIKNDSLPLVSFAVVRNLWRCRLGGMPRPGHARSTDIAMRLSARLRTLVVFGSICAASRAHGQSAGTIEKGDFRFAYDERGISLLAHRTIRSARR